jgi:hypothetical protein
MAGGANSIVGIMGFQVYKLNPELRVFKQRPPLISSDSGMWIEFLILNVVMGCNG